jgi:flagella basal body P-ring formation protein FlgA
MLLRSLAAPVLAILFLTPGPGAWAASFESPDAIRAAVQAAAESQIVPARDASLQIEIGEVDPRLHLAACAAPDVFIPSASMPAMTARVSCRDPFWTLYVPLHLHAWGQAVVAANNLAPGTQISASDLAFARLDILAVNGAFLTDPAQAEGQILRANVRAGAPILAPFLDRPMLVHRGDTLVMTLLDSTVTIKANMVAMEDGRAGDRILVENPDSKKTLRATVADAGSVELRFDQAAGR